LRLRLQRIEFWLICLAFAFSACRGDHPAAARTDSAGVTATSAREPQPYQNSSRVAHVLVALCDNLHQGIVPVAAKLGDGEDLKGNLYWGAGYGVRTFFSKSAEWKLTASIPNPSPEILERCIFRQTKRDAYLIADAYRGAEIKKCIIDFLDYSSGKATSVFKFEQSSGEVTLGCGGNADLIVFVGHNGLMDFDLASYPTHQDARRRDAMVLCCASKTYFSNALRSSGADPVLWTNGLMAPEAYVLSAALAGWIEHEDGSKIRARAAQAYNQYQKCGIKAATHLFASGW
jgi:hypothetical protein